MDSGNRVWKGRTALAYRKLADGGMLYDEQHRQVHHFNATAALVWEACLEGCTLEQVARALCAAYEVEEGRARTDAGEILEQFALAGLLEP